MPATNSSGAAAPGSSADAVRLVVTRPVDDAGPLAAELRALGHHVIIEPLLKIKFDMEAVVPAGPWRAVLATSANGIRALQRLGVVDSLASVPLLAVGGATAEAARLAGLASVQSAGGDLESLVELVRRVIRPGEGRLLYPSGRQVSGDLAGLLGAEGYTVVRTVLYEAMPAAAPGDETVAALRSGAVDGVLLMSRRTAETWTDLIRRHGLDDHVGEVRHYCLSQAVAEVVGAGLRAADPPVAVAAASDMPSLLALLDR